MYVCMYDYIYIYVYTYMNLHDVWLYMCIYLYMYTDARMDDESKRGSCAGKHEGVKHM